VRGAVEWLKGAVRCAAHFEVEGVADSAVVALAR
jgi:hypothetical protein